MKKNNQFTNRILSLVLVFMMVVSMLPMNALAASVADRDSCTQDNCTGTYQNGFCTICGDYQVPAQNENGYYEISNAGNLYWFSVEAETNKKINAVLTEDIDLNPGYEFASDGTVTKDGVVVTEGWRHWEPIGVYGYDAGYQGIFDGNFHTVSGMYCIAEGGSSNSFLGLFSRVTGGTITELGVTNGYVFGLDTLGGIAGHVDRGTISKCWNEVTVNSISATSGSSFGGIVGSNLGVIENCCNLGLVSGRANALGGIVGSQNTTRAGTMLNNCYNIGPVVPKGTETKYGHIAGIGGERVFNCYYLSDSETDDLSGTIAATEAEFASGKVTYLLNQGITDGSQAWYQTCGEETPAFIGKTVYAISNSCYIGDEVSGYTNEVTVVPVHNYNSNGFCENMRADGITACDHYQPCEKDANGAYEIKNAGQLYWFAQQVNDNEEPSANAVLTADIIINEDMNTTDRRTWIPIGDYKLTGKKYSGTFDGKGYTILGLYCDQGSLSGAGLFGNCEKAVLKNINVKDSYFHAEQLAGAIAGNVNSESQVTNCHSINNTIIIDSYTAGGVLGGCDNSIVDHCSNTSTVTHLDNGVIDNGWRAGGIVGWASNAVITNCWNSGEISARRLAAGGIVGGKSYNLSIENCYNVGTVTLFGDAVNSGAYSPILGMAYDKDEPGELNIANCYYLEASYPDGQRRDGTTEKSEEAFISGEVAYLLNGSKSDGELVWYQILGKDIYPQFTGSTVYYDDTYGYNNGHIHEWNYELYGKDTITAACTADGCPNRDGGSIQIIAPTNLSCDGNEKSATLRGSIVGVETPKIVYEGDRTNAGTVTASIALDGVTAGVTFEITTRYKGEYYLELEDQNSNDYDIELFDKYDRKVKFKLVESYISSEITKGSKAEIEDKSTTTYAAYELMDSSEQYPESVEAVADDGSTILYQLYRIIPQYTVEYYLEVPEDTEGAIFESGKYYLLHETFTKQAKEDTVVSFFVKDVSGVRIAGVYEDAPNNIIEDSFRTFERYIFNENATGNNGHYSFLLVRGSENTVKLFYDMDMTPPTGTILIEENRWNSFQNTIIFGLFFKDTQTVIVNTADTGSGVDKTYYYLSSEQLLEEDMSDISEWEEYTGAFNINPDNKYVIYVKVIDKAGNITYISSDGIVLDSIAPELYGIEDGGVYYGDKVFKAMDENFLKIEVDGTDITDTTEGDDEFKILADNAQHTVTVTDKAGNVTEYRITVYKIYSVTFTDGAGGSYEKNFKYGEVIAIPANEFFEDTFCKTGYTLTEWQGYTEGMTMPLENLTFTAVYTPNNYTVEFDTNGGESIAPVTVTFDEKYGSLPSSAITGLSGGDSNWYLVDENASVTDTNIKNTTKVSVADNHTLFVKRRVLAPAVSIKLAVPGGISDSYPYYIPGASQRILTAIVGNMNTDILDYTYQWYKGGTPITGATANVLILEGNVADSGTYEVVVTAMLKNGVNITVTSDSATASKEQNVKILHSANTLSYDANGGEGGPQSAYTGGTSLNVSKEEPTREHYDFISWNTVSDGSGDSYTAEDIFTFMDDGGNGGCVVTLYAQWKLKEYVVTFAADGTTISTETVEYGKDAVLPAVPEKDGYVGKWDGDGKNIEGYTTINAVYTAIPVIKSDEVKPGDKTNLECTKAKLEEELKDSSYTEEDKQKIQDAIDDINEALEVIGNVEKAEELIDKLPENITKNDEDAIKAADDAYNTLTDYEKSLVDEDAKKALYDAKAAFAELNKPVTDPDSPQTGDNSNLWLRLALLFVSGGAVITLTVADRKRKAVK